VQDVVPCTGRRLVSSKGTIRWSAASGSTATAGSWRATFGCWRPMSVPASQG
jgi:hypothetical protein